jgi:hypothetical protein
MVVYMFGWFKKSGAKKSVEPDWIEYKGFRIAATPKSEGGQHRVGGRIEKGEAESLKSHSFVRADLIPSLNEANDISLMKARLMVDQLGDRLFSE